MVKLVRALKNESAFGLYVKGDDGISAEIVHVADECARGCGWQQVSVKKLALQRTCNRAVRADERYIEAQHFRDRQRERVATASDKRDFNSQFVCTAQGGGIGRRYLELRVEQGAIDIDGDKTDGRSH